MTTKETCAEVRVLSLEPAGESGREYGLWRLTVDNPGWAAVAPGQFAMLRPERFGRDPLWARPFSICRLTPQTVAFHFQEVGRGTRLMAGLAPGDRLVMWGPLGRGFAMEPDVPTLLLAGGVGLAPFVELAHAHPTPASLRLVFGHRPPLDCYPFAEIAAIIPAQAHRETAPGDLPAFLALVEEQVRQYASGLVLACGPLPFLKYAATLAARHGVRTQVSLENRMACGVGACLGCVEKNAHDRHVQVCKHGPVFWAHELQLGEDGHA